MAFTYIMTLFHIIIIIIHIGMIIANFVTSSIHILSSSECMNSVFTMLSIFPAFRVIMDVTFDNQTASTIKDVSILRATMASC